MSDCHHVKIYHEAHLFEFPECYQWTCSKCSCTGTEDNNIRFIYTYEHLLDIKRDEPLRHSEDSYDVS